MAVGCLETLLQDGNGLVAMPGDQFDVGQVAVHGEVAGIQRDAVLDVAARFVEIGRPLDHGALRRQRQGVRVVGSELDRFRRLRRRLVDRIFRGDRQLVIAAQKVRRGGFRVGLHQLVHQPVGLLVRDKRYRSNPASCR